MKKIRITCSIVFIFIFMICGSNISVKALENQVLLDEEYLTYKTEEFRTVSLNRKSFIGVANSPQNPPACRMYGF